MRVTHVSASIFKQILSDHHLRGWCGGRSRLAARSWAGAGAGGGGHHAAARCRCQCAGAATSAAHRGQPQRSLWGWADLWEGGREALKQPSPGQCGFRLCVVQQYRLWQTLQGGPGCGFSLNHDCQVSLVLRHCCPSLVGGGKLAIIYGRAHGYFETLGHADYWSLFHGGNAGKGGTARNFWAVGQIQFILFWWKSFKQPTFRCTSFYETIYNTLVIGVSEHYEAWSRHSSMAKSV